MQNVSKRTILWIVPIIIIGLFWYFYGPQEEITDHEYISYIKETTPDSSASQNFETSFANYCEEEKWIYFQTQKNHHVVEFKGKCPVYDEVNFVNLQFIVEDEKTGYQVGALLLEGEQQSDKQRDAFIKTVVSNEKDVAVPTEPNS